MYSKFLLKFFILLALGCSCLYAQNNQPNLLVVYDGSDKGHTKLMADAVADGAKKVSGITVKLVSVKNVTTEDVKLAKGIIIGSPVYNANVTPEIQSFINTWPHNGMRDKLGAAFVSAGGISAGQESTLLSILRSMLIFRMLVIGGDEWQVPFGVAAIVDEAPFDSAQVQVAPQFLRQAAGLGTRMAMQLKNE